MESAAATSKREGARAAIVTVARLHGLPDDLHILSERWNTVARLGDAGVIAKATTLAHLVKSDPIFWFRQEVSVCDALHRNGAPVHAPLEGQTPIAIVGDLAVTLWHEVDGEMGESPEDELVTALAELHRIGAFMQLDLPWFATLTTHFADVMPKLRERSFAPEEVLEALQRRSETLLQDVEQLDLPTGFIHGDAQRKNAIRTDNGAVWIDLEECSVGPFAWDLACLTMHRRFDTARVLDRYAELSGLPHFRESDIDMLKELRDLEGLTWMMAIQHEREPEFQDATRHLLVHVLAGINGG